MPREVSNPCNKYIGLSEAKAIQLIRSDGLVARITGRDGEAFMGTCDYRTDRVNIVVTAGRVITADIG